MALDRTYFLDAELWETYGFINSNIDTTKLNPIILRTQKTRIEPILGTTLYNKIKTEIDADTLTGIYKTCLDDYVLPCLIAYCDWKYTFHSTSQMTNKTTGKNSDEHIQANDTANNNNLRDELLKDAKQYERKLIGWLCDNYDNIPELCEVDDDKLHQSIRPSKDTGDNYGQFIIV